MKDMFTNYGSLVIGAWPSTVAKNASGASASDGTPFTADLINDLWGWIKNIMYLAGITPSGSTDTYLSSDVVNAIRRAGLQPGLAVKSFLNPSALALARLLPLTGQILLMSSYPELCAAVYVGDANNAAAAVKGAFYKCTAGGVASTSGTYMKMPDCRGVFLRGLGTNGTLYMALGASSPYYGGTYMGDVIPDRMHGHRQSVSGTATNGGTSYVAGYAGTKILIAGTATPTGYFSVADSGATTNYIGDPIADPTNGSPRTGPETNPVSVAAQICISY